MRNLFFSAFSLLLFTALATAQRNSGNVFFGYSYYSTNLSSIDRANTSGWEGTVEGKVAPFLGIIGDFSGHFGSENFPAVCNGIGDCVPSINANISEHNFLFGPRVAVPFGKFRPFAELMFGAGHGDIHGASSDTSFASAVGGGLDYRFAHLLAWRFQGDYVHTHLFGSGQNNVRFSTGIVLRF